MNQRRSPGDGVRGLLVRLMGLFTAARPHWLTSTARQRRGARAERAAATYLRRHGYKIHATNLMTKAGEIDILASEGEWLCFIEVRSMTITDYGPQRPAFTRKKERTVGAAMDLLVKQRGWQKRHRRADLVEVYLDKRGNAVRVEVLKAAIH